MGLCITGSHIPHQNKQHELGFSVIMVALDQLGTCLQGGTGTALPQMWDNMNISGWMSGSCLLLLQSMLYVLPKISVSP